VLEFFVFLWGLAMGSFGNVLIYRLPRGESIVSPPSHCPGCNVLIKPRDNIPVLSYILLKGRCRECGWKIPARYPVVELLTGLVFLAVFMKYGMSWLTVYYAAFAMIMIVQGFIDGEHFLLLDSLNIAGGFMGIAGLFFIGGLDWREGLGGAVAGGGMLGLVYLLIWGLFRKKGMGLGDIKTAAVAGIFLGPLGVIFMFIFAAAAGILFGLVKMAMGKGRLIPFGAMMAPAAIAVVLFREGLMGWIFGL